MDLQEQQLLKERWEKLIRRLESQFGDEVDLQSILFLIGVQELGKGPMKYSKDEKQDLMHIAVCRLLSKYGYYILEGVDENGWPAWSMVKKLPPLTLREQDVLLRQAVLDYFEADVGF